MPIPKLGVNVDHVATVRQPGFHWSAWRYHNSAGSGVPPIAPRPHDRMGDRPRQRAPTPREHRDDRLRSGHAAASIGGVIVHVSG